VLVSTVDDADEVVVDIAVVVSILWPYVELRKLSTKDLWLTTLVSGLWQARLIGVLQLEPR
jgi:hypothetical protein